MRAYSGPALTEHVRQELPLEHRSGSMLPAATLVAGYSPVNNLVDSQIESQVRYIQHSQHAINDILLYRNVETSPSSSSLSPRRSKARRGHSSRTAPPQASDGCRRAESRNLTHDHRAH